MSWSIPDPGALATDPVTASTAAPTQVIAGINGANGDPSFDTGAMGDALADVTNRTTTKTASRTIDKEESRKLVQAAGWVQPQSFKYDAKAPTVLAVGDSDGEEGFEVKDACDGEEQAEASMPVATWAHDARKYEWKDSYGDVGPRDESLEAELFRGKFVNRAGIKFENLRIIEVKVESETRVHPVTKFEEAGLHPVISENIKLCGYETATPIQAYTIPAVLTGSGKTAAFLVPCMSKLMGKVKKLAAARPDTSHGFNMSQGVVAEPLILIVSPTRELCCQTFDEARRLCYRSMMRPCVAYGGAPIREQKAQLARGCDILAGTPGRLIDLLGQPNVLSLKRVRYTIIDEADELLQTDWEEELKVLMAGADNNLDSDHRYLLFSATFPKRVRKIATKYLAANYIHVSVGRTGSAVKDIRQQILWVDQDKKMRALYDLLLSMPPSRTLVFVRFKKTADFLDDYLFNMGLPSTSIHSDRTQAEREDSLRAFKAGTSPILVATGVSARGLDILHVMHIVNFDLPNVEYEGRAEYVHRIGRTGRIGNEGLATSFYNERDEALAPYLTKVLMENGQQIPDFLEQYKPVDDVLNFDEDEDSEEETEAGAEANGGDTWGAGGPSDAPGDAWGAAAGGEVGADAATLEATAPADEWTGNTMETSGRDAW